MRLTGREKKDIEGGVLFDRQTHTHYRGDKCDSSTSHAEHWAKKAKELDDEIERRVKAKREL